MEAARWCGQPGNHNKRGADAAACCRRAEAMVESGDSGGGVLLTLMVSNGGRPGECPVVERMPLPSC